jgi:hypothetical protein
MKQAPFRRPLPSAAVTAAVVGRWRGRWVSGSVGWAGRAGDGPGDAVRRRPTVADNSCGPSHVTARTGVIAISPRSYPTRLALNCTKRCSRAPCAWRIFRYRSESGCAGSASGPMEWRASCTCSFIASAAVMPTRRTAIVLAWRARKRSRRAAFRLGADRGPPPSPVVLRSLGQSKLSGGTKVCTTRN